MRFSKRKSLVSITDVRPRFVDTQMAKEYGLLGVQSPQKASRQIINAIEEKRKVVYITKRWLLIALILKALPDVVYDKI